jgi:hypothetical protein
MCPYFFFTVDPWYVALWKSFWSGRGGEGVAFTAGRTGNINYSWGGYVAQLADVGMMGAVLAAFHAIMVARSVGQKVVCWGIWGLWMMICFGTGTRGFTVFVGLPVIMLLFLKYNYAAAVALRWVSGRAYAIVIIIGIVFLFMIQVQGQFRNVGFSHLDTKEVDMKDLAGNEMFTTTLTGMKLIPEEHQFFADRYVGEGLIRAIPEEAYWLAIDWFPRALWTTKPIDPVGAWYSDVVTGEENGVQGTTISGGAVGTWYFKYGPFGVVQIALLYGWWMSIIDRSIRDAAGRPMAVLFTLAFATFMFRAFRDLWWHNLYPIIISGVVMYMFVRAFNILFGGGGAAAAQPAVATDGV